MIGTLSEGLSAGIRTDFGNIPIPTFVYTGSGLASERTRLE
ncbi:MAG: hypothetical protein H6P95_911, partial [Candidatus Aminicenantes bacterium]|nr:hypothetical protein [Candidatus Aminicenantes bacterium]